MSRQSISLFLALMLMVACARPVNVPRQYKPYYEERGFLRANPDERVKRQRLPFNIGEEILPSYIHNNLYYFEEEDTIGVDETFGIFEFKIRPDGTVKEVELMEGNIPEKAQENLIAQFQNMRFAPSKRTSKWYLPFYIEVPRGEEIRSNGLVFEGKEGYLVWVCYNPRDVGVKRGFQER